MNNQTRPICSKCGAEHSEMNRVNWWDSNGVPYGPKSRPEQQETYALCDNCAYAAFEGLEGVMCKAEIGKLPWSARKEFLRLYSELYENTPGAIKAGKLLSQKAVYTMMHSGKIAGFAIVDAKRESIIRNKYFVEIYGIYVAPPFRGMGFGKELGMYIANVFSDMKVNYVKFAEFAKESEASFMKSKFLDSIEIKGFKDCYRFRDVFKSEEAQDDVQKA